MKYNEKMNFDVLTGINGDCYDRYVIRVGEMRQSVSIIMQCLNNISNGAIRTDDKKVHHLFGMI